jgi:type II secretory pathway pseudopilin PulG
MMSTRGRRFGLTTTHVVLIVCAAVTILAVTVLGLAAVGTYYMAGAIDEGNQAKAKADIRAISDAVKMYKTQHGGRWPQSIDELCTPPDDGGPTTPYLSPGTKTSPWGTAYEYDPSGQRNSGLQPDVYVVMPNGKKVVNWSRKLE